MPNSIHAVHRDKDNGKECRSQRPFDLRHELYWISGWAGPTAKLDIMEKEKILLLLGIQLRPPSQ